MCVRVCVREKERGSIAVAPVLKVDESVRVVSRVQTGGVCVCVRESVC